MSKQVKNRTIRVRLSNGSQVNGQVNISGYDRLSDLIIDRSNNFLVITKATLYQTDLENPIKHETMFLATRYIVWAAPDNDEK